MFALMFSPDLVDDQQGGVIAFREAQRGEVGSPLTEVPSTDLDDEVGVCAECVEQGRIRFSCPKNVGIFGFGLLKEGNVTTAYHGCISCCCFGVVEIQDSLIG